MEAMAMIWMAKMAEFVYKHIVLKHLRKADDVEIKIDVSFGRAAAPVGCIVLDCHTVICKSITSRKLSKTHRQLGLGLAAQRLDL